MVTKEVLQEFKSLTKYSIENYFQSFILFIQQDYPIIINYYLGDVVTNNSDAFKNLTLLRQESSRVLTIFQSNSSQLNNYKWWELLEQIEDIDTKLLTISVVSKWLRSSISTTSFNPNPEVTVPFRQGETLESIERTIVGETEWRDKWTDIAFKNDLAEEDYTSEGGNLLKINFNASSRVFQIESIVDNPNGENILGIDLDKKLQFDLSTQDLKVLTPRQTFTQTVQINLNLRKGDNPNFPEDGLNPKIVVGSTINAIAYPTMFRQIIDTFRKDDTIKNITFISVRRDQDAIFLDFEVQNRLGETLPPFSLKF